MRVRLNGWQRIGIVLSVIWALGGFIWGAAIESGMHEGNMASENHRLWVINDRTQQSCFSEADTAWNLCEASVNRDLTLCGSTDRGPDCSIAYKGFALCDMNHSEAKKICDDGYWERDHANAAELIREHTGDTPAWYFAAIFAFVPIPLAWLIVYAFIGLWRWTRRGFNN